MADTRYGDLKKRPTSIKKRSVRACIRHDKMNMHVLINTFNIILVILVLLTIILFFIKKISKKDPKIKSF